MEKYITIGTINRYLKNKFDTDVNLNTVYLKGEISNFKGHTTGHLYFSLKDETSKINAIMFRSNATKLAFQPNDGDKVLVIGRISVYEATGAYQIYVEDMQIDGIGNLYLAFEKLKKDLESKGLFDQKHKKKIPTFPKRVGVVTASTGAAIKDIITTINRRFPSTEIVIFPTLVQGVNAAESIVKNIKLAENYDIDTLIVGRGGGSLEDLWPFNEEIVAYAIFESTIPIISAVGHEIDFTIADFVADLRAPTPTAAAEMAVLNINDLIKHINQLNIRLNETMNKKVALSKIYLENIKNSYVIKNPLLMYDAKKQYVDILLDKLNNSFKNIFVVNHNKLDKIKSNYLLNNPEFIYKPNQIKLNNIINSLEFLNPLKVLKRGYSISSVNNNIIKNIKEAKLGSVLITRLSDGIIKSEITHIEGE